MMRVHFPLCEFDAGDARAGWIGRERTMES